MCDYYWLNCLYLNLVKGVHCNFYISIRVLDFGATLRMRNVAPNPSVFNNY